MFSVLFTLRRSDASSLTAGLTTRRPAISPTVGVLLRVSEMGEDGALFSFKYEGTALTDDSSCLASTNSVSSSCTKEKQ